MTKPFEFTISRRLWMRGNPPQRTGCNLLYDSSTQKQCCIGHYCSARGVSKELMDGVSCIGSDGVFPVVSAIPDFGLIEKEEGTRLSNDYKYNEICNNLYEFNDTSPLPRSEREKAIAAEFKKINVIVHFVD